MAGVPQATILSPVLFNLALKDLPQKPSLVPTLQHNLYSNDITVWRNTGSPAEQELTVQTSLDVICSRIHRLGLTYCLDKSEFIVISKDTFKKAEEYGGLIHLHMERTPIPRRDTIQVLGFHFQHNRKGNMWMEHISKQINQIHQMLARVTRRGRGLREHDLRKTIDVTLSKTQANKLETLLC